MKKILQNRAGFTLIEVTLACVIIALMAVVLGDMYMNGTISSGKEMKKSKLQVEAKSALDGIVENVKLSAKMEDSFGGYTGGADTLILSIPAIDDSDAFLYSGSSQKIYDHIIYYVDENDLHKLVLSSDQRSRLYAQNNSDQILLDNVQALTFSYDIALPGSSVVTANLTIQDTKDGNTQSLNITALAKRRNSE